MELFPTVLPITHIFQVKIVIEKQLTAGGAVSRGVLVDVPSRGFTGGEENRRLGTALLPEGVDRLEAVGGTAAWKGTGTI